MTLGSEAPDTVSLDAGGNVRLYARYQIVQNAIAELTKAFYAARLNRIAAKQYFNLVLRETEVLIFNNRLTLTSALLPLALRRSRRPHRAESLHSRRHPWRGRRLSASQPPAASWREYASDAYPSPQSHAPAPSPHRQRKGY